MHLCHFIFTNITPFSYFNKQLRYVRVSDSAKQSPETLVISYCLALFQSLLFCFISTSVTHIPKNICALSHFCHLKIIPFCSFSGAPYLKPKITRLRCVFTPMHINSACRIQIEPVELPEISVRNRLHFSWFCY